ncbi:hypothetical protein ACFFX0_02690 [Citricoccus parietis]|uniref:Uncharacterized protein n=1 Tax=Citricoccus parietis TaxID=592307 RepID=A0ABV5FU04_9MICC
MHGRTPGLRPSGHRRHGLPDGLAADAPGRGGVREPPPGRQHRRGGGRCGGADAGPDHGRPPGGTRHRAVLGAGDPHGDPPRDDGRLIAGWRSHLRLVARPGADPSGAGPADGD